MTQEPFMEDEITPSASEYVAEVRHGDWVQAVFSDEVFWKYMPDPDAWPGYTNVVRFPFVPGWFLCVAEEATIETGYRVEAHRIVSGPYPTLKSAKAACLVLGPQPEQDPD